MITNALRYGLCIAALSLAWSTPSRAQAVEVETGVFCDTQKQIERYVAIFSGNARAAMHAVNIEENDPTACVYGTIAFIRGPEIATARSKSGAFHIVKVVVVGFLTETGLRAAAPSASFSVEKIDERIA